MSNPTVCAVMLVNGRPEMVARAVRAFEAQTYAALRMLIYASGEEAVEWPVGHPKVLLWAKPEDHHRTIGDLRNRANLSAVAMSEDSELGPTNIIVHWDSDDWSHPNRIAEQVALLQASGAECVGYREMLFWETGVTNCAGLPRAWLYSNPLPRNILGTSLCYWRKTWEAHPFPDTSKGEDTKWLLGLRKVVGVGSLSGPAQAGEWCYLCEEPKMEPEKDCPNCSGTGHTPRPVDQDPRMIASIHGGNTCARIDPIAREWRRVPEWDEHCRRIMEG